MSPWSIRVLLSLAFLLTGARSMAADIEALEVVDVGLYRARITGEIPAPLTPTGRVITLSDVVFYSVTRRVPARLGTSFGTRFRVVGAPAGRPVTLRSIWRIPEPGISNPATGVAHRESVADFVTTIGRLHTRGFHFEWSWEIRCGDWVYEVWQGERKLLSQTFTVEDCQGVPTAARRAAAPAG